MQKYQHRKKEEEEMRKMMIVAMIMATTMVMVTATAVAGEECVRVNVDPEAQTVIFHNYEAGFPGADNIYDVVAVSERTGWSPKRGIGLGEHGRDAMSLNMKPLLYKEGTTRFNLVAITESGEKIWFMVDKLCFNGYRSLVHETDSPDYEPANGDQVMALEAGGKFFSEWKVKYRN